MSTCCPLSTRSPVAGSVNAVARPPECRPRLEHQDAHAALGQRGRGAQAREAAADDDDINAQCQGSMLDARVSGLRNRAPARAPSSVPARCAAAMSARWGRGTRMRDVNTS